jgi:CubicO group peptidase (beta-lactamase class C family)
LSIKWAGGGIISTVEDLAKFHIALNTGKLLQAETLAEIYTPYTLADGNVSRYGLGWNVQVDDEDRTWIAHGGGATGGSSYLLRYPEGKLAVAMICNVQSAGDMRELALEIAERLLQ